MSLADSAPKLQRSRPAVSIEPDCFAEGDVEAPRHLLLRAEMERSDIVLPETWLLAEAWWADSFPEPGKPQMLTWLLRIVPWLLMKHISARQDQVLSDASGSNRFEKLMLPLVYAFALPLTFAVLLVLGLLYAISAIPIKGVDQFAIRAQQALSARLGDSYVFVSSRAREALIKQKVRATLDWVSDHSEAVVIVAHSQGAAVSFEVLQDMLPRLRENMEKAARKGNNDAQSGNPMFLSYGSGIAKLSGIRRLVDNHQTSIGHWPIVLFATALLWLGFSLRIAVVPWWTHPVLLVLLVHAFLFSLGVGKSKASGRKRIFLLAISVLVFGALALWARQQPLAVSACLVLGFLLLMALAIAGEKTADSVREGRESYDHLAGVIRWVDIYSTRDPVPNGSLFSPGNQSSAPRDSLVSERIVVNRASSIMDHTSYWNNLEEFVTWVVTEVSAFAKGGDRAKVPLLSEADEKNWSPRSERIARLQHWRWYLVGTWIALLPSFVQYELRDYLAGVTIVDALGMPPALLSSLILGIGVYSLYQILSAAWELWNEKEVRAFLIQPTESDAASFREERLSIVGRARKLAFGTDLFTLGLFAIALVMAASSTPTVGWLMALVEELQR
ncbi:MAG: hypothetical protein K8J08_06220 [Thermoanaerobaculia bacterium]|nr:hypothetical protein [Thermoanaerobaculia bacterium]